MASAVTFDVSEHDGLSARAKVTASNDAAGFVEHNATAEDLLGLAELTLTGRTLDMARRAVARQVSFQIESGLSALIYKREKIAGVEKEYSGGVVDPLAGSMASQVLATLGQQAKGFKTLRTFR